MSRPVILIHGAWQGAWAWNRLIPSLDVTGYRSVAVDLPGNGTDDTAPGDVTLDLYVSHLKDILDRIGPAHVIAHSGGGIAASQLAEDRPEGVLSITYIAGMMLPDGGSFSRLVEDALAEHPEVSGVGPYLVWSSDGRASTVPRQVAMALFFNDCAPDVASTAADMLSPQPEGGRDVSPRLSDDRFGRVPRLYVEASADRSVAVVLQRRMQALVPGATVVTLPSGHAPHVSIPEALCEVVVPFIRQAESANGK